MKKQFYFFILFALFILFISCSEDNPLGPNNTSYHYKAFDKNGNLIVSGYLWIEFADSSNVTGHWDLKQINITESIGPQVGQGEFRGVFTDGLLNIDLNPDMVDNNVVLSGTINNTSYQGNWIYYGFAGLINTGSFFAKR